MKRTVEFTGKKVQEAVDAGLKSLGITLDDADIKIIDNGGLFKKAKVSITYDDGLNEAKAVEKEEEVSAPAKKEKPAKEPKQEKPQSSKTEKKQKDAPKPKAEKVPDDEPHWGSAPVKLEPTTKSNFGKSADKAKAKAEKPAAEEKAEKVETAEEPVKAKGERKNKERKENKKKQRESVEPTSEQVEESKAFLSELLSLMKIEGTVEVIVEDGLRINVETEDSRVIGHRGEVLDSLGQLVSSIINTTHGKFVHVTVDGLGYRDRRKETLEGIARRMADKAVRTRRKVTLDAMNSADRRIIHATLGDRDDVFTRSEGHDPARRVAIIPKRNNRRD